ncbi:MAG: LPS-assembly protein LptD, partial [Desulfobacterales bacterium]|nr:LPS-assembly protein LptD [Desulfobacterales bacterium]
MKAGVPSTAQAVGRRGVYRPACLQVTVLWLLLLLTAATGRAQIDRNFLADEPDEPWHVSADTIIYGDQPEQITAQGHVTIKKAGKQLSADLVRLDQRTMQAFATGHVILSAGQDVLVGSSMEIDLKAETGTVYDATVFLRESHFYIRGAQIQKTGQRSYAGERVSVSTCDGPSPDWQITGRNLEITLEGYGVVRHAALWAKRVPLLYTPFLVFPVKLKRQSGLLSPQLGFSNRKGAEYIQPFFWAISDSTDATLYAHYMSRRGLKAGLEYRYLLSERSEGALMYDFLQDRQVDDG